MDTRRGRWLSIIVALLTTLPALGLSTLFVAPAAPTLAQGQETSRTFPETGHAVSGRFLDYWNTHGGLAQQGYPISEEMQEVSGTDGKTYTVQYFERAVFELHPENTAPNDVLLSLLGVFLYHQKYPAGAPNQVPSKDANAQQFSETGHTVGGLFLIYWNTHGGLAQQGYPISDEFNEKSDLDGKTYLVQYFQRAVFEYHPENTAPYNVLLSQLGTFQYKSMYGQSGTGGTGGTGGGGGAVGTSYPQPGPSAVTAQVVKVVDGDTIDVSLNGQTNRVRYIGMDTPETVDPNRPVGCYGPEASDANKRLVEGKTVTLEKDVSETDRYGRLLRYIWVGTTFVNAELVKQGYAQVATYPPDVKYTDLFLSLQTEARNAGRGLWGACQTSTPTPAPATATPGTAPLPTSPVANPTSTATPQPAPQPGGQYIATATVDKPTPTKNSYVTVTGTLARGGQGVAGATMDTSWHYKTTTSSCSGTTDANGVASCTRDISRATAGYTVVIDVVFTLPAGGTVSTETSFTPH